MSSPNRCACKMHAPSRRQLDTHSRGFFCGQTRQLRSHLARLHALTELLLLSITRLGLAYRLSISMEYALLGYASSSAVVRLAALVR